MIRGGIKVRLFVRGAPSTSAQGAGPLNVERCHMMRHYITLSVEQAAARAVAGVGTTVDPSTYGLLRTSPTGTESRRPDWSVN